MNFRDWVLFEIEWELYELCKQFAARSICTYRCRHIITPEELALEAAIRLFLKGQFKPDHAHFFKPTVRFALLDSFRDMKSNDFSPMPGEAAEPSFEFHISSLEICQQELRDFLKLVRLSLTPTQAFVFDLYLSDHTTSYIAECAGISERSLSAMMSQIRKRIMHFQHAGNEFRKFHRCA